MTFRLPSFVLLSALAALLLAGCSAEGKRNRSLERATTHFKAGDLERARLEYHAVLQKFPDDPAANKGLALVWMERGASVRALALLTKVLAQAPGDLEAKVKRAELLAGLSRPTDARREALAVLQQNPGAGAGLILLSETVRDGEDLKALDAALQRFPDRNAVAFHLATANGLRARGDRAGAAAAVQRALQADPKSAAAHAAMAAVLAESGAADKALAEHKAAVSNAPLRSKHVIDLASFLIQAGATNEAVNLLQDVVRQASDYLPAWRSLALLAALNQKGQEADALLARALAVEPTDYQTLLQRAGLWLAAGETPRAISELERLRREYPGIGLELNQLAGAYLKANDPAKAVPVLQQSAALFPENVETSVTLAQLLLRGGDAPSAVTVLGNLINRRPDVLQAYPLLVEAAKASGKLDELAGKLADSVAKLPDNPQLLYALGLARSQQGKVDEGRAVWAKLRQLAPDFVPAIADAFDLEIRAGQTAAAVRIAESVISRNPKAAFGQVLLARARAAEQKWVEALAAAKAAIDLEPAVGSHYALFAQCVGQLPDKADRLARVDALVAQHASEVAAVLLAGQVYQQERNFPKVREIYEKFLAAKPDSAAILNNLANLVADDLGQLDQALPLATKARQLDAASPAIADTLGWILHRTGKFEQALPLIEQAVRGLPGNAEVVTHFGLVNAKLGRRDVALNALRQVSKVTIDFPGKGDALRVLAELEAQAPAASAPAATPSAAPAAPAPKP